ncbi:MAG: PhzF family phenazine biosynthesis protein, partial [Clostridiales Family XIII bacterium]|nr:PhzF family phenazine biosynthesis protein [Clostridiales Family XIII bacterium]
MKFFIVDAFADNVFSGNPAGVVLLSGACDAAWLADDVMRKIAAELRYSETAFVRRVGDAAFETRYFTPVAEVD